MKVEPREIGIWRGSDKALKMKGLQDELKMA